MILPSHAWGLRSTWGPMSKLSWFKHYNTAHEGISIATLWHTNDTETIAFYWTILEMISRWEEEESRGEIVINLATFKAKLGMNSQRSRKLLAKISQTFKVKVDKISEESYKLSVPNWLELQETRGGKRLAKNEQSPGEERREKREERREIQIREKEKEKKILVNEVVRVNDTADNFPSIEAFRMAKEKNLGKGF